MIQRKCEVFFSWTMWPAKYREMIPPTTMYFPCTYLRWYTGYSSSLICSGERWWKEMTLLLQHSGLG